MNDLLLLDDKMTPAQLCEKSVKLAQLKKQIDAAYKEVQQKLLEKTQELDIYTLKTGTYTITRAKRITPVIEFDTLKATLEAEKIPYTTKVVFGDQMADVFKQALKDGKKLEGLESKESEYITIRVRE